MFFFLSKLFTLFLSPLTWGLILFLLALLNRKNRLRDKFLISGLVVLYLFSNSFIRKEAYRYWEYPLTNPEGTFDYAIVLGGFTGYDYEAHRMRFSEAGDRFFQAYRLYQEGKVKKILISGGSGSVLHKEKTEADKVLNYALSIKMPEQDFIIENNSRNTHENAVNTAKWISLHDPSARCLLVTSASHMPRALGCYQKAGLPVTPYTTDRLTEAREYDPENLFVPDSENLTRWAVLIKEIIGIIAYKMVGYL